MITPLALLLALLQQPTPAHRAKVAWVPNPRTANGGWVADPAHHLQPATVAALNSEIGALEAATGAEIAVVVVDSTSGLEPFDFALALHRSWGVGKRDRDNGVLLLWVPEQRSVWISVGYGLEGTLPDRKVGRIRDTDIFPPFRRGAFDEGVIAGVRALAAAAREEGGGTGATSDGSATEARGSPGGALTGGGGILSVLGGGIGYARWRRRRPRPCPNGHGAMRRLDEQADNAFLDGGERLEEDYKSVDYDVWRCDSCGHTLKIPYKRWTSSYKSCPDCKRRTLKETTRRLVRATSAHEGRERVTQHCGNCGHQRTFERSIPRVSTSSSSSGGGGGRG